jgi:serine/threonine protein phosphatase 1
MRSAPAIPSSSWATTSTAGWITPACIERILQFREDVPAEVVCLMGNHEEWFLQTLTDPTDHTWLLAVEATETIQAYSIEAAVEIWRTVRAAGHALFESRLPLPYSLFFDAMPAAHLQFLRSLPVCHRTTDAICTHGGLDPELGPLEGQTVEALLWGTDGFQERYAGPLPLVYGLWRNAIPYPDGRAEPAVVNLTIGIDSIRHGTLTAVKMPEGLVLQSNGERCWTYSCPDIYRMPR